MFFYSRVNFCLFILKEQGSKYCIFWTFILNKWKNTKSLFKHFIKKGNQILCASGSIKKKKSHTDIKRKKFIEKSKCEFCRHRC